MNPWAHYSNKVPRPCVPGKTVGLVVDLEIADYVVEIKSKHCKISKLIFPNFQIDKFPLDKCSRNKNEWQVQI